MPMHAETPAVSGLGRAQEGQGRLDAILHVELAVPYFPFSQTTPISGAGGTPEPEPADPSAEAILSARLRCVRS